MNKNITYFGQREKSGGCTVRIKHSNGITTHLKHQIVRHSPTGFQWGYMGSGPADLALNMLLDYCQRTHRQKETAEQFYQQFKAEFIALAGETLEIQGEDIEAWLEEKGY